MFAFALALPAHAQLAPGTKLEGRLQAEFSGKITDVVMKNKRSGFIARVEFAGNFASGMPFTGIGEVAFETDAVVAIGDTVEGRFRAEATGEIVERSGDGVFFIGEGEIFRGEWMTETQYGANSKGGGTNWFRIERGEMNVMGSAEGNNI